MVARGAVPPSLRGSWKVESLKCGGKEVTGKVGAQFHKPNALFFHFTKDTASSEWKKKKCRYEVFYQLEELGAGRVSASPTGQSRCEPKKCLAVCEASIPLKVAIPYDYQVRKKQLVVSSPSGLECLTQGLPTPSEIRLSRVKR